MSLEHYLKESTPNLKLKSLCMSSLPAAFIILSIFTIALIPGCKDSPTSSQEDSDGIIVFAGSNGSPGHRDIYQINPDGSGKRIVDYNKNTFPLNKRLTVPKISPDGSKFAYIYADKLYMVGLKQSKPNVITGFTSMYDFSWSNDASKVAFTGARNNQNVLEIGLFTANSNGDNIEFIDKEISHRGLGNWSPEDQYIVFVDKSNNSDGQDIFTINANGTQKKQITNNETAEYSPKFSNDGSKILYRTIDSGTNPPTSVHLKINSNGTNKQKISTPKKLTVLNMSWSPSDESIVYDARIEGKVGIYIFRANADGSNPKKLTDLGFYPIWVKELTR